MASELISLSNKFSLTANGGEFVAPRSSYNLTLEGPTFVAMRAGSADTLASKSGYVIRGVEGFIDIAGFGLDADPASMAAAAGFGATARVLLAVPRTYNAYVGRPVAPLWHHRWEWDVADTSVPLGLLYAGSGDVNGGKWAGVATGTFMLNTLGIAPLKTNYAINSVSPRSQLFYRISPKPQWKATVPASLSTGQVGQASVTVTYPDGEPVTGLAVRFVSNTEAVAFGDALAYSIVATTDAAGVASVPLRAVTSGAGAVQLSLADQRCAPEFFSPAFGAVLPVNAEVVRVDGQDCVLLPAIAAVPAVPATRIETGTNAWDSGANSEAVLDGDVVMEFSGAQAVVGGIVGFTADRDAVPAPSRIAHGWYLHSDLGGMTWAQVYEAGKVASAPRYYTPETVFRIERRGNRVAYFIDGDRVRAAQSAVAGEVSVGVALYGANDFLFEWESGDGGGDVDEDTIFSIVNDMRGPDDGDGLGIYGETSCEGDTSAAINESIYNGPPVVVEAAYPVTGYAGGGSEIYDLCGGTVDDIRVIAGVTIGARVSMSTPIPFAQNGAGSGTASIPVVELPAEFQTPDVTFAVAVLGGALFEGRKPLAILRVRY